MNASTFRTVVYVNMINSGNYSEFTVDGQAPEEGKLTWSSNTNQTLSVYYGQSVTLTLTPKKGNRFTGVTVRENNFSRSLTWYDASAPLFIDFGAITSSATVSSITEAVEYYVDTVATGNGLLEGRVLENGRFTETPDVTNTTAYGKEKGYYFEVSQFGLSNNEVVAAILINGEYVYTAKGPITTAQNYAYVKSINGRFKTADGRYYVSGDIILTEVDQDLSVEVVFAKSNVGVNLSLNSANGEFSDYYVNGVKKTVTATQTIIAEPTVDYASSFAASVTAKAGYIVDKVIINGDETVVSAKTFNAFPAHLTENYTIVVYFTEETYVIDVTASEGGRVTLLYGGLTRTLPFRYKYGDTTEMVLRFTADTSRGKVIGALSLGTTEFTDYIDEVEAEVSLPSRTLGSIRNFGDYHYSVEFVNRKQTITVKFSKNANLKNVGKLLIAGQYIEIPSGSNSVSVDVTVRYGQNATLKTLFNDGDYDGGIYISHFKRSTGSYVNFDEDDADRIKAMFIGSEYSINSIGTNFTLEVKVDMSKYLLTYAMTANLSILVMDESGAVIESGTKLDHGTRFKIKINPDHGYDLASATLDYENNIDESVSSFTRTKDEVTGAITAIESNYWKLTDNTDIILEQQYASFEFSYENHMVGDELIGRVVELKKNDVEMSDHTVMANDVITFKVALADNYIGKYNIRVIKNGDEQNPLTVEDVGSEHEGCYVITIDRNTTIDVYYDAINISIYTTIQDIPKGGKVQVNTTHYSTNVTSSRTVSLAMTDVTILLTVGDITVNQVKVIVQIDGGEIKTINMNKVSGSKYVLDDVLKSVKSDITISIKFY